MLEAYSNDDHLAKVNAQLALEHMLRARPHAHAHEPADTPRTHSLLAQARASMNSLERTRASTKTLCAMPSLRLALA